MLWYQALLEGNCKLKPHLSFRGEISDYILQLDTFCLVSFPHLSGVRSSLGPVSPQRVRTGESHAALRLILEGTVLIQCHFNPLLYEVNKSCLSFGYIVSVSRNMWGWRNIYCTFNQMSTELAYKSITAIRWVTSRALDKIYVFNITCLHKTKTYSFSYVHSDVCSFL